MHKYLLALMISGCIFSGALGGDLPDWMDKWTAGGDFRLRGETIDFDRDGVKDRNRFRFRLRLGAGVTLSESLALHFRFASGDGSPTSTNQSFDNSFENKDFRIDRAFAVYKTGGWTLGGGKVQNPFETTDIVWDSDVNPEGFFQTYRRGRSFVTLAEMILEEEATKSDTNLAVLQLGTSGEHWKLSGAYYHYSNYYLTPAAAIDYTFFDLLGTLTYKLGELPCALKLHFVNNTTDEAVGQDTAWAFFGEFGKAKKPGDWAGLLKYAEIEPLSVFGAFADSDFGFVDREGFVASCSYRVGKHVTAGANLFLVDSIRAVDAGYKTFHLDVMINF